MLVLSRKSNEVITIGDHHPITVRVLKINDEYVRLGIDAPRDIPVHRQEIYDRIHAKQVQTQAKEAA